MKSNRHRFGLAAGHALAAMGKTVRLLIPGKLARAIDDRFFGAVF